MPTTDIAGSGSYGAISVSTVAVIIPANQQRVRVYIKNTHATANLFIGTDSSVAVGTGYPLEAVDTATGGQSVCIEGFNGAIYGVAETGTVTGRYFEVGN